MEGGGGKRKEVKIEHGSNEIINSTNFFESFFLFVYVLLVCLYFFCVCVCGFVVSLHFFLKFSSREGKRRPR